MIDIARLNRQIENALSQPESADPEVAVRRQLGLRFVITTRSGQTAADVRAAVSPFSPHFVVEPLFPAPTFQQTPPGEPPRWSDSIFLAIVYGVAFADVDENAWDLARDVCRAGGFVRVAPEFPFTVPAAEQDDAATLDEPGEHWGWERAAMRIEQAWEEIRRHGLQPGGGVVIGHPDCGYREHEVWNQGNLDRKNGRSFMPGEDRNDATERAGAAFPGHGLATASVMAAPLPLKEGTVTGVAPHAVVLPIRCNNTVVISAIGTESIVVNAVRYAMERKCQVISISMGGLYEFGGPHPRGILYSVIQEAINADIIVVAAAGQYLFPGYPTVTPANGPRVIGVAGIEKTTRRYQAWGHSCRSPRHSITISAPARTVTKAAINGGYATSEGTSYAAAFVAGVAALWFSRHYPSGYPRDVKLRAAECFRNHVLETRHVPQGFDSWFSGMIDAYLLVATEPDPDAEPREAARDVPSLAVSLAQLIDPQDPDPLRNLLEESVRPDDEQEEHLYEIGCILASRPNLRIEIARSKKAGTLNAQSLSAMLAPEASQALRGRLQMH